MTSELGILPYDCWSWLWRPRVQEFFNILKRHEPIGSCLEVARDGIEPPTHGFSVHCSTN